MRARRRVAFPPSPLPIGEPRLLAALWLLTLFTLSSIPFLSPPGEITGRDKIAHLVVYSILGHLLGNVAWERPWNHRISRFYAVLAFGSAWGVFDELYQGLVPGRSRSAFDWMADTLGVLLGVLSSWQAAKGFGAEILIRHNAAGGEAGGAGPGHTAVPGKEPVR